MAKSAPPCGGVGNSLLLPAFLSARGTRIRCRIPNRGTFTVIRASPQGGAQSQIDQSMNHCGHQKVDLVVQPQIEMDQVVQQHKFRTDRDDSRKSSKGQGSPEETMPTRRGGRIIVNSPSGPLRPRAGHSELNAHLQRYNLP